MDAKEFVRGVRKVVMEGALDDVLEELSQPSVITPASREEDLRAWYASLQAPDREMLAFALEEAVDAAVFGLLAVIDGVRSVEDPEVTGKLELWYEHSSGRRLLSGKLHELLYSMEGPEHCERSGIQAIDHDPRDLVGSGAVGDVAGGAVVVEWGGFGVAIVLADKNDRQIPDGREVQRLVECALV